MEEKQRWFLPLPLLHCLFPALILLNVSRIATAASSLGSDLGALLAFKAAAADTTGSLATWNITAADPCATWRGVGCSQNRVTRLVLEGFSLSGDGGGDPLRALTKLDQLRILSLKSNLLSGPIPDLSPLLALKLLFLSHNNLSGPIPPSIAALTRLYRLDLSSNDLTGAIPTTALTPLRRLLTLRLDSNQLTGPISNLSLPDLQDLNVSSNHLTGPIPASLAEFPAAAFSGNPELCGSPLLACSPAIESSPVVSSSPSSKPQVAPTEEDHHRERHRGVSRAAVVAIVVGDFAVLLLVSALLFYCFWKKFSTRNPSRLQEGEKIVYSASPYAALNGVGIGGGDEGLERGRMVFLEGRKRFELEDLLRASAEMLGKGGYGTAYKAVLDDGSVVAVKRLRDVQVSGKREFEHHMEALGRLRHPNLVPLNAYYYARDEKLLVYDFMPNGSLFSLLHGNRGPGRTPLDWTARMLIAAGAARGLAFVHHVSRSPKLVHGNVKSTNVLLDRGGNPRLADVGLALLGSAAAAGSRGGGYRAPETPPDGRRPWSSQRADVYAFGVVLLELLTGRSAADGGGVVVDLPRWVASVVREEWTAEVFDLELMKYKGIEEEMVGLLQVAMACTATAPDQRPGMGHVVRMIDEIRGGGEMQLSPSHESFDSVSDSPSVSEDAAGRV